MVGIPHQVDDKHLEAKVLSIFQKVDCTTTVPEFIDDCHGLGKKNDKVIVKFTRRKDCKQVIQAKKNLKQMIHRITSRDVKPKTNKKKKRYLLKYWVILC